MSVEDKTLIAKQINSGAKTSKEMADLLGINTMRVNYISRKLRLGSCESGRPRLLDFESELAVRTFLDKLKQDNDITKKQLKRQITKKLEEEYTNTMIRRNKLDCNISRKQKISNRTLIRYLNKFNV